MTIFDDILGSDNSPTRPRGRPKGSFKKSAPPPNMKHKKISENDLLQLDDIYTGVSVDWLCKVFRMSRTAVVTSLQNCPKIREGSNHYDLATAAAYLVDPVKDLQTAMKKLRAEDLPQNLQEGFWNAQIKELKYQTLAGELWPTQSVLKVLGDAFKSIRSHTMLWADSVEEKGGLTPKQHSILMGLVDQLLSELHKALVAIDKKTTTRSKIADLYDPDDDAI